jgi:Zn-dependent alcohol dehydrogenase
MPEIGESLFIQHVELSEPKANEVLGKIKATGVCHSDLYSLNDSTMQTQTKLGHEGAGIVEAVGANVTNVKVSDKVDLSWVPYAEHVDYA